MLTQGYCRSLRLMLSKSVSASMVLACTLLLASTLLLACADDNSTPSASVPPPTARDGNEPSIPEPVAPAERVVATDLVGKSTEVNSNVGAVYVKADNRIFRIFHNAPTDYRDAWCSFFDRSTGKFMSCWGGSTSLVRESATVLEIKVPRGEGGAEVPIGDMTVGNGTFCAVLGGRVACSVEPDHELASTYSAYFFNLENYVYNAQVKRLYYVKDLSGINILAVNLWSACATIDARAVCWGARLWGILGTSQPRGYHPPSPVVGLPRGVTALSMARMRACAVVNANTTVMCWGTIYPFFLSPAIITPPTAVRGLDGQVLSLSSGGYHHCALVKIPETPAENGFDTPSFFARDGVGGRPDGTTARNKAMCWGDNYRGQLGDGNSGFGAFAPLDGSGGIHNSPKNKAVNVRGLAKSDSHDYAGRTDGVSAVVAGLDHSCALVDGRVMCWGRNQYGQLGNGNLVNQSLPVPVKGLPGGVTAIGASATYSCAIVRGEVFCWGQLGHAETGLPVKVLLPPRKNAQN